MPSRREATSATAPDGRLSGGARTRFALLLMLVVLALTLPRLWLHEMWRDEAWLWLVATGSPTFPALFDELSRSGQGYLFPILAWLAARISSSPLALQLLNLVVVVATAFVIGRWAPLRRTECVLLVFGYYLGYEYAVLSRHYALGALLLFAACALARDGRHPVLLATVLGLLCQTTVYGFILALVVAAGVLWLQRDRARAGDRQWNARQVAIAAGLALAGAVAGLVQLVPEAGTSFAVGWRMRWEPAVAVETLQLPWRAMLPLLQPTQNAWNTDVLGAFPGWRALAGLASLALAIVLLWPRRLAVWLFLAGTAALLAFAYLKYVGTMRHHGHLWLLLVAAVWIAGGLGPGGPRRGWREYVLLALLVVQTCVMVFASALDLQRPFSNGLATAQRLRALGLDTLPLLGYREPPAASVALGLGRALYAPSRGVFATHTDWGPLQRDVSLDELRCAARALAEREASDVVLVMTMPLPPWPETSAVESITGAIVSSENFFLHRLHREALADSAASVDCGARP